MQELTVTELLVGKNVCVIGGADKINNAMLHLPNTYYVRINWHFRHQGGPVDAIYATNWKGEKVPPVLWVGCELGKPYHLYVKDLESNNNLKYALYSPIVYTYGEENTEVHKLFEPLLDVIHGTPSTGILAIYDLLNYPIKDMYLTGFDFYQNADGTHRKYQIHHDFESQYNWLYQTWKSDKRIIPDEKLLSIFKSNAVFV